MQTVTNVARWFFSRSRARAVSGEEHFLTNPKLQKLLYYAQGMHLALYGVPLFEDKIIKWQYSPVVESVYQEYKENGADFILNFENPVENFSADEEAALQFVQDAFGQFSAWKLAEMIREETPWKETATNEEIPREKIRDYFEKHYVE